MMDEQQATTHGLHEPECPQIQQQRPVLLCCNTRHQSFWPRRTACNPLIRTQSHPPPDDAMNRFANLTCFLLVVAVFAAIVVEASNLPTFTHSGTPHGFQPRPYR